MNLIDVIRVSSGALTHRRMRAALTILGVVIGIVAIVVLISLTEGLTASVSNLIGKTGSNMVLLFPSSEVELTSKDLTYIQRMNAVKDVVPFVAGSVTLVSGGEEKAVTVTGIDNTKLPLILPDVKVEEGTLLPPYDTVGVLIGPNIALPPGEDRPFTSLGKLITVEATVRVNDQFETVKKPLLVKGIFEEYGTTAFFRVDDGVYLSLSSATNLLGKKYGRFDGIIVVADDVQVVDLVVKELQDFYGKDANVISPAQLIKIIQSILSNVQLFLGGVAGVSLIVAGVGIANIMYVSVLERTKIIGVLRAVGAKSRTVLFLFLTEALLIGLIGGVVGVVSGVGLSYAVSYVLSAVGSAQRSQVEGQIPSGGGMSFGSSGTGFSLQPVFTPWVIIMGLAFALAVSTVAGFYPAWKASKLDPAVAIRSE